MSRKACCKPLRGRRRVLNRFAAAFAGANAIFKREDEDLAVADLPTRAGAAALDDRVDRRLEKVAVHSIICMLGSRFTVNSLFL